MIQLLELAGQHILPFREPFSLPLLNQGLVLVKGRNDVSQAMDANGVGKTSLLHILSWVLFGIDLRGRRGDDIACRFTNETCVGSVTLKDEAGRWTIHRTRRPAALEVEGTDWTGEDMDALQVRIESRLGFGARTFRNAMVFGQGTAERFASADPADQLRMLDEIQGLDFRDALKRAREWAGKVRETAQGHEADVIRLTDLIAELEGTIRQLKLVRDLFVTTKNERLADLERRHLEAIAGVKTLEREITRREGLAQTVRNTRRQWDAYCKALQVVERDRQEKLELDAQLGQATAILQNLKASVTKLLKAGKCPACRQPVTQASATKHFHGEVHKAESDAVDFEKQIERRTPIWREHQQTLDSVVKTWPLPQLSELALAEYEREHDLTLLRERVAQAEATRDGIHDDLIGVKRSKWDSQALLEKQETALARYRDGLAAARTNLERTRRTEQVAEYWIEAFGDKGLRSLLVDSVAGFLNERLVHHLTRLAGGEVSTVLSAQTLLKSGRTKERLSLSSTWAWGGAGAEAGSAGQDRRVDLALFAALQDLAESRSARPFPLKCWDEPGDALDTRGKELFAGWVAEEARERGTGLLITHSPDLESLVNPDVSWVVVLDEKGARVER